MHDSLLSACELTPQILADDDARVSPAQFHKAWSEGIRASEDPHLALRIAAAAPPGSFGLVEYVCRASPNLGAALKQWVRYLNLLNDAVLVGTHKLGENVAIRVDRDSESPAPASHELCFALLIARARALSTRPVKPVLVEFSHALRGDIHAYEKWFDSRVNFSARNTQIMFDEGVLESPLSSADAGLAVLLEKMASQKQGLPTNDPPMTTQVKRLLRELLRDDEGNIEPIAQHLGLSPRNLQRRLKDEGTTFQLVRENTRRELADEYLSGELSVAEVSFLLGFSEPSAFFRAFKRWTGKTPQESRAQRRASLA